jgi:hypothetical protein
MLVLLTALTNQDLGHHLAEPLRREYGKRVP